VRIHREFIARLLEGVRLVKKMALQVSEKNSQFNPCVGVRNILC
jgi:hypothetical protein